MADGILIGMLILCFLMVAEQILPPLMEALGDLCAYLADCLLTALLSLLDWLLQLSVRLGQLLLAGLPFALKGLRFAWLVLEEIVRPSESLQEEEEAEYQAEEEEFTPATDPYEIARELLGLPAAFSQVDLKRAYRRAISATHPDRGGDPRQAMAINQARDLIKQRHGWR
jgi:hypothetical protein